MGKKTQGVDIGIVIAVLALVTLGIVMVFSASAVISGYVFLLKQIMWAVIGIMLMVVFANIDYNGLQRFSRLIVVLSIGLLAFVLFSHPVGGARRWLRMGMIGFQPSELAKLGLVLYIADLLDRRQSKIEDFKTCLLPVLIMVFVIAALIYIEPDLGSTAVVLIMCMIMLFMGGAKIYQLFFLVLSGLPLMYIAIFHVGYRRQRLLSFLNPDIDIHGIGYQLRQSLLALGSGGLLGKGLGASRAKLFYLPQPHTDFILPVIGEELGFLGVTAVIVLFVFITVRGCRIALRAPNLFGSLVACGITMLISLNALINVAVVTASVPTKGLPLPFVSFGGSSLIFSLIGVGILLNISTQGVAERKKKLK